jgi:hypothetical protein
MKVRQLSLGSIPHISLRLPGCCFEQPESLYPPKDGSEKLLRYRDLGHTEKVPEVGDDEPDSGEELATMPFHIYDYPALMIPLCDLVLELVLYAVPSCLP